jgi:DNA replication and repair protein RecF
VNLRKLWLTDFRSYEAAELEPDPDGLTVIRGPNGQGKTNLLEAVAWLATMESFRGAPREALVRRGATRAVLRAEGVREGRRLLVEAEIPVRGRERVMFNRQPLRRSRDLLGALRVSVFSPADLEMVQGAPVSRRDLLDNALVALASKHDALRTDVDKVLRQRGALLKQADGRSTPEIESTLDVWDSKLAELGTALARARAELVTALAPLVSGAYRSLAGAGGVELVGGSSGTGSSGTGSSTGAGAGPGDVSIRYCRSWDGDLGAALLAARREDLRRGVSTIGPHRDDVEVLLAGMPARTHASQGEQRGLALALRLGVHALVTEAAGSPPLLLLDDVFSELDPDRSAALVRLLPAGQALVTTAGALPEGWNAGTEVWVREGKLAA